MPLPWPGEREKLLCLASYVTNAWLSLDTVSSSARATIHRRCPSYEVFCLLPAYNLRRDGDRKHRPRILLQDQYRSSFNNAHRLASVLLPAQRLPAQQPRSSLTVSGRNRLSDPGALLAVGAAIESGFIVKMAIVTLSIIVFLLIKKS